MNPTPLPSPGSCSPNGSARAAIRTEPATRPFSRGWEDLLEDAALVSATDRTDAERDARELATGRLDRIKTRARSSRTLIDRIVIPLAAEAALARGLWLCAAIG
jgi:hypothetical protein